MTDRPGFYHPPHAVDLVPCPFCKANNRLDFYRFKSMGFLGETCAIVRGYCDDGDSFAISCECGCELVKCQDELVDRFYESSEYDAVITPYGLWTVMFEEWNKGRSDKDDTN